MPPNQSAAQILLSSPRPQTTIYNSSGTSNISKTMQEALSRRSQFADYCRHQRNHSSTFQSMLVTPCTFAVGKQPSLQDLAEQYDQRSRHLHRHDQRDQTCGSQNAYHCTLRSQGNTNPANQYQQAPWRGPVQIFEHTRANPIQQIHCGTPCAHPGARRC